MEDDFGGVAECDDYEEDYGQVQYSGTEVVGYFENIFQFWEALANPASPITTEKNEMGKYFSFNFFCINKNLIIFRSAMVVGNVFVSNFGFWVGRNIMKMVSFGLLIFSDKVILLFRKILSQIFSHLLV